MKKAKPRKSHRSQVKKIGMAPGTLVHVGEVKVERPVISIFEYDTTTNSERTITADEAAQLKPPTHGKLWLNVHGVHDVDLIQKLGNAFKLHPLVLEDILNTDQRPKVDSYNDYLFIETRCFYYDQAQMEINSEQISIVLGRNFVLSFQERATGAFEPIRQRLRVGSCHMRELGSDYLAYALIDSVVDRYFGVLEQMSEDCEMLEEALMSKPNNVLLHNIHQLKRASIELRRTVWPLREVVNNLTRNEDKFFSDYTLPYLRDVYDHTVHCIESLEAIRDLLGGMMDIYLSTISNRVNLEVRALTVVAMLFMPATLISGIFGMNFHNMPVLEQPNGFLWALSLMGGIALSMLLIFWRRQWLTSNS